MTAEENGRRDKQPGRDANIEILRRQYEGLPNRQFRPDETPVLPWLRFYVAPGGRADTFRDEWEEGEDYVDAPSAVAASLFATRLYGEGWGTFSRAEWKATEKGEKRVLPLTLDGALPQLAEALERGERETGAAGGAE